MRVHAGHAAGKDAHLRDPTCQEEQPKQEEGATGSSHLPNPRGGSKPWIPLCTQPTRSPSGKCSFSFLPSKHRTWVGMDPGCHRRVRGVGAGRALSQFLARGACAGGAGSQSAGSQSAGSQSVVRAPRLPRASTGPGPRMYSSGQDRVLPWRSEETVGSVKRNHKEKWSV